MNTNLKQIVMKKVMEKVNVAPSSDEGHFVKNATNVIDLESETTESYIVEGDSELITKNHTSLKMKEDCLVNTQVVYNPFSKIYEKVID